MKHKRHGGLFSSAIEELNFVVNEEPIPKARPRFNRKTGITYTPQKTTNTEKVIGEAALKAMEEQGFHKANGDMPVCLYVTFYHTIPKGKRKWWNMAATYGLIPCVTRQRGDVDNKVKLVMDGLNGIAFDDDSQVCEIHAYSRYSAHPHTDIKVVAHYVNVGELKAEVEVLKELENAQTQAGETDL